MKPLIAPYGGTLVDLMSGDIERAEDEALHLPSLDISARAVSELELLMNGAYSPLKGFMGHADYEAVLERHCLAGGTYWPWPIVLEIPAAQIEGARAAGKLALRDPEGLLLALLAVEEIWEADIAREARVLGLDANSGTRHYISGRIEGVGQVPHHDFPDLRRSPAQMRNEFASRGWRRVIALQTRQPLTRAQYEFAAHTAAQQGASLLLLPMVTAMDAVTCPEFFALVRGFQAALPRFPAATTMLSILALPPHAVGPRELALRTIVARNYGVAKLIVGGSYQGEGPMRRGGDAARLADELRFKTGVELLLFPRLIYAAGLDRYVEEHQVPAEAQTFRVTGGEMLRQLQSGLPVAPYHVFPEVLAELHRNYPPRERMGVTIFFTGLSGSGKSTLARALAARLMEIGSRPVTLLDGDVVRKHLSSELGFSPEHRAINIRRIGYVASEITKHRGFAICAPIAPYEKNRSEVRDMISPLGGFVEIYVATPLEICEGRDRKGLYAKARAGVVKSFTGISDPYEIPQDAELVIDTTDITVEEGIERIVAYLRHEGYLPERDVPKPQPTEEQDSVPRGAA
jgi:sulfate adenylyltransferase